jgi:hypothetical protein
LFEAMNDEHQPDVPAERPVGAPPERDPALAALEAAWRTGALVENEPTG